MSNQSNTVVPHGSETDHGRVSSPQGGCLCIYLFDLRSSVCEMTDGIRAEGGTTKKDTRGSAKTHFRALFCLPACSTGCLLWKTKTNKKHPILQLLFLSQTGRGVGDVGAGEEWVRERVPAIFSLKCNELPAIFPPHFLLRHSNGASRISRRRRHALCCVFSFLFVSESWKSRILLYFFFFFCLCCQPTSAPPRPLAYQVWEPVSHFLCWLFRELIALTRWRECARTVKLPAASSEQMSRTSSVWVGGGCATLG